MRASPADYSLGGYADRTSVAQGQPITFYIATDISPFDLQIANEARPERPVAILSKLTSQPQDCTGHYETGCDWKATTTLTIPTAWPSGYYSASFPTSKGQSHLIFVVRSASPGSASPVVLVATTNTYQAYNAFGGKSVYDFNSPNRERASHVSFNRPYDDGEGRGRFPFWEQDFIRWLQGQQRSVEVISDTDLEDPEILSHYKLVVIAGHSEYWTLEARQHLEKFSQAGGHIAIFAGNTMWWQARYENDGRTLVVYKDAAKDPRTGSADPTVTVNWFDAPVYNPENTILGASFRNGGYANKVATEDVYVSIPDDERKGFTVVDPNHWLMAGANLKAGSVFGKPSAGLEVDGVLYNCIGNEKPPVPDGSDGTPLNYHILATTPGDAGHGTVGIYTNPAGGAVFNAGSRDWVLGLGKDPVVDQITTRILDRLSTGNPLPYDAVKSQNLTQDLFNCPQDFAPDSPVQFAGWQGNAGRAQQSERCAYEGPSGLELTNSAYVELGRNFSPTNAPLNPIFTRMYLNADNLSFPTPNAVTFTFMNLQNKQNDKTNRLAQLQLFVSPQGNKIRLNGLDANGKSAWIPLGAGWRSIEVGWQSPGQINLWVDEKIVAQLDNPISDQGLTELVLTFPNTDTPSQGYLCIDAVSVAHQRVSPVPAGKRT